MSQACADRLIEIDGTQLRIRGSWCVRDLTGDAERESVATTPARGDAGRRTAGTPRLPGP